MTEVRPGTLPQWRSFAERIASNKMIVDGHARYVDFEALMPTDELQTIGIPSHQKALPSRSQSIDVPFLKEDSQPVLETIIDRPNLLPAYWLALGAKRAKAVCKLLVAGTDWKGASGTWSGTGFLISDNILLTNHHVLNTPDSARQAFAIFNYEDCPDGSTAQIAQYNLDPKRLFLTSSVSAEGDLPGLDFTFVWVEGQPGQDFGYIPLLRNNMGIMVNEFANIIQHPGGRAKAIAIQENNIISITTNTIHYGTDTEPGGSGSPVFDNNWIPIGLHHAAYPNANNPQQYINEGITLAAIANRLEFYSSNPVQAATAKELLALFKTTA